MSRRVGIIGSGNFGSCISRVVADNIAKYPDEFHPTVEMWVFDELVDGESLVKIINTKHENVKYLPGHKLPETVVAVADVTKVTSDCNFLIFVIPHQFLNKTLESMKGHVRDGTVAISLIKGITFINNEIELVTDTINRILGIQCGSLMGANIANDIAKEEYCESTIAFPDEATGNYWLKMLDTEYFHVRKITDIVCQQLCGTLKNIIAIGGGIVDGLGLGQSTKAAILRQGNQELFDFAKWYFPDRGVQMETMMESCGFGDIVASSYGGRNRKCAEYFVKSGKSFEESERDLLNGQKLQGTLAAIELYHILKRRNAVKQFPLMSTIYFIIKRIVPPIQIIHTNGPHLDLDA